ncbi:hypothetical protein P154DRAFT_491849 [Amniculicola lignicola CBS 123094]|uniref:Nucleoporin Pom152 n=1 Tax=Amniculicola lignicola CBS 123094 TaxID=1392246 RepID=A0A6A5WGX3_9PLEO|nr:hypothetical protein P154DRAFT_491849 [Amniculicola lignicola CBS 123094]
MNGTPRRGPGGFPTTPQTGRPQKVQSPNANATATTPGRPNVRSLPEVPTAAQKTGPLIPNDILDAASQRFYVFAFYIALWAWRLYDFYSLTVEDDQSLGLCLKWCFFDMVFLFGIPLLEIPWLEWSNAAAFLLFTVHAVFDVMLMFRIGIPVQTWLVSLLAVLFDSEVAINERNVKPGPILHNASLILGKQIIHILPEGSAILNPDKLSFCLNASVTSIDIPILINQTQPVEIELVRLDIDDNHNETTVIKARELKKLLSNAKKAAKNAEPADPLVLLYTVKKPGVYLLNRVLDQSKLEVRPRASSLIVVKCPQARVKPTGNNRCRHDLSDVALEVEGTPPLRIKYRTTINGLSRGASEFQGLQPEDLASPLSKHTSQALIRNGHEDVSWAQAHTITVSLNETLTGSGTWEYAVEEVHDALGNMVNYALIDEEDRPKVKPAGMHQSFTVHERPNAFLSDCSPQRPLRIAKGTSVPLPIQYGSTGREAIQDSPYTVEYLFTPQADILLDGNHGPNAELKTQKMKSLRDKPLISTSGLYTITSVSTDFCGGEVLEPASCLLQNPPEPELTLSSENIVDKCAGRPIGLRVALDFVGTPPFKVHYVEKRESGRRVSHTKEIRSLRGTIDLAPEQAGHYSYTFESITDGVYASRPLHDMSLEQDVRPSASARFLEAGEHKQACIDDSTEFDVALQGEGPWKLEYEIVHNGKRTKHLVNVEDPRYTITTQKLTSGGEYTVALTSITDKMGCKEFLKAEAKVNVRHERPKAYFGLIDGKQAVMALEGKDVNLPLRFTGTAPWHLKYKNIDDKDVQEVTFNRANDRIQARDAGKYQLLSVRDGICPGFIDEKASQFSVGWIARPKISVPESTTMVAESGKYVKEAVCEGDDDNFEITLSGHPPFDVTYEQSFKDKKSGKNAAFSKKNIRAVGGGASIRAETSQPGTYEYKFVNLADNQYDHSPKHFSPVTVQHTVNPHPNAHFSNPGKTYSYCSRESDGEEVIPMSLEGVPPFYLEVEIKQLGSPRPEVSVHKNIPSTKYDLKIEHRKLHLGTSTISIRKIRDARGCTYKPPPGPRVQISVHDAPTATPLEERNDFCVGERLSFALSGQVPFQVYYTFEGQERKAGNPGTTFKRLAELPGTFVITGLRDSASECLASLAITKEIHPIPTVRLSGGQVTEVDIHEGGGTDLEFSFTGTPPFEFMYTRSTNAVKGKKSRVLEIRTEKSEGWHLKIPVQEEGTYEVVSIKDRWCGFAKGGEGVGVGGQKMLAY